MPWIAIETDVGEIRKDSLMTEGQPTASSPQDVAASFPTAADDPQQLTQEIHETREQLGETVEALADKADVTALAEDKTSQLSGRLRSGASQAKFRAWLEQRRIGYVVAVPCDQAIAGSAGTSRADILAAHAPARAWKRLSCGQGAKGPRIFDWAAGADTRPAR
jgi:Protein of unknown function (DUF3618)